MIQQSLNWYSIKLLYVYEINGEPNPKLMDIDFVENYIAYEESILLIEASTFDMAYTKAEKIAKKSEGTHQNLYEQTIQKKFYDFIDCFLISPDESLHLKDELEVYSNIIESNTGINKDKFINETFPIKEGVKYMLLNNNLPLS